MAKPSTWSQGRDAGGVERVLIRPGGRKWSGVGGRVGGGTEGCPALCEKERSIIRLHNYFLGHKVDIIDPE